MFDWLFEGQTTVYVLFATVLIGLFFIYWQWRRKVWLYAMLGVFALVGVYWLLDRLVETDREEIQRKIETMAAGVRNHNADAVFEHVSDSFRSPRGNDKASFRQEVAVHINQVQQLTIWDYRFEDAPERGKDYDGLRFSFKVVPNVFPGNPFFEFVPIFAFEGAKGWQLKGFKIMKPGTTEEIPIPF